MSFPSAADSTAVPLGARMSSASCTRVPRDSSYVSLSWALATPSTGTMSMRRSSTSSLTAAGLAGDDATGGMTDVARVSLETAAADIESSRALNTLSTPRFTGGSVHGDTVIDVTRIVSDQDAIADAANGGSNSIAGAGAPHDESSNTLPQCALSCSNTAPVCTDRETRRPGVRLNRAMPVPTSIPS